MVALVKNSPRPIRPAADVRFTRQTPCETQRSAEKRFLVYNRARYYDPATGEFISRDPLEYVDGMSLYRGYFVPRGVDPSGLNDDYYFSSTAPGYYPKPTPHSPVNVNLWRAARDIANYHGHPSFLLDWAHENSIPIYQRDSAAFVPFFALDGLWLNISSPYVGYNLESPEAISLKRVRDGGEPAAEFSRSFGVLQQEAFHAYFNAEDTTELMELFAQESQWPEEHRQLMGEESMSECISALLNKNRCVPKTPPAGCAPFHTGKGRVFPGIPEAEIPMSQSLYDSTLELLYGPGCDIPFCD